MRSGYENAENDNGDWSSYDQRMASEVLDRTFSQSTFHSFPSLRAVHAENGWIRSKPYQGEEFDVSEWRLVPGGWDHEHCLLCWARVVDAMTYWANKNEVVILCDYCFDHYRSQLIVPA